jgi:copper chaperone CopZ
MNNPDFAKTKTLAMSCHDRIVGFARIIGFIALLGFLPCTPLAKAAESQFKHRITGLFAPSREADLLAALEKLPDIKFVKLDFEHSEATLAYDADKLFPKTKPADLIKKLDEKLRSASNHTLGVQPLSLTPRDQLTRVVIPVAGLDCKACCLAAYESIYKIDGVEQATASFKEAKVTALIDTNKTDRTALETALKKHSVTVVEQKPHN